MRRGPHPCHLVDGHAGPDTAATHGQPPLHLAGGHGPGQGHDKVRVIISRAVLEGAEILDFVPHAPELLQQVLLELKTAMVRSDADLHTGPPD